MTNVPKFQRPLDHKWRRGDTNTEFLFLFQSTVCKDGKTISQQPSGGKDTFMK
jgi:hypothetical protein